MVKGMRIGKWHAALAHGHEGVFVAGHSGAGDTGKNERAMVPIKAYFRASRRSYANQDADLTKIQARSARERQSLTIFHTGAGPVSAPAPQTENSPCGKHPAAQIVFCLTAPAKGRRPPPAAHMPLQNGTAPLWDDAILACGRLSPAKRATIVVRELADALQVSASALSGVRATLFAGIRLVHGDGTTLGIVRATPTFNGAPRYNDVRFLEDSGTAGVKGSLLFARLALVFTVTLNDEPGRPRNFALLRMFQEVPAPAATVDTFGQNLEFVPIGRPGDFKAVELWAVEDTWSMEPDGCAPARFHPNQYFRSTTEEALEREELT